MRTKVLSAVLGLGLLTGSFLAAVPAQAGQTVIGTPIPRDEAMARVAAGNNLGAALGPIQTGLKDDGAYRQHERGFVIYSVSTGAQISRGAIRTAYGKLGYEKGRLGYPTSLEGITLEGKTAGIERINAGITFQTYQGGTIAWTSTGGAHALVGAIRAKWQTPDGFPGLMGAPLSDEVTGLRAGGATQTFRGGAIVWSSFTGAQVSKGAIRTAWLKSGAQNGSLGYPTSDEFTTPDGTVRQNFQHGQISWTAKTGATITPGTPHTAG